MPRLIARALAAALAIPMLLASLACASGPRPTPHPAATGPQIASATGSAATFTKRVEFAILEDYDKGEDLGEVERDFRLFRELGIRTWRGSFGWDDYEPARGAYDFAWLHRFAERAEEHGITLRPYIGYTPGWAGTGRRDDGHAWNDPPANLADWERFVDTLGRAMSRHANVASWEIYNEPDVKLWWDGTADEFYPVLARAARALRRVSPRTMIFPGGLVWPDAEWLEGECAVIPGAGAVDVVALHAYPETWTPESVTVESYLGRHYRGPFLRAVTRACGRRAVWINESGFATTPGKTEQQQADWWARAIATFLADRHVEQIGVYEIKDLRPRDGASGDAANYHLGLTRADRKKKMAFHTVKLLVGLLDSDSLTVADGELRLRVIEGDSTRIFRHLFRRPDGRQVAVVWTRGEPSTVELTLERVGRRASSWTLGGDDARWRPFDGTTLREVHLVAGEARIFVVDPPDER